MKKLVALIAAIAVVASYAAWQLSHRRALPAEILDRPDLHDTSVSYAWTGGFSLGNYDVHVQFSGNGQATLQVGDNEPVHSKIPSERYRELLPCMAENDFWQIKVKRRWGAYQCDIGRSEVRLRDRGRETVVFVDEKHFVDKPEHFERILEQIYSFDDEFGQRLDYGPVATTCVRDTREITAAIIASLCLLACVGVAGVIWTRKRSKNSGTAEPTHPPVPPFLGMGSGLDI